MLVKVASKDAETFANTLIKNARKLPQELYKSLTWDRGTEMAGHQRFTLGTTVMRAILDLERRGLLVTDHSNGRHNTYRLTIDNYPQPVAQRNRSQSATGSVERPDQSHSATPPVAQRDTNRHLTAKNHHARARDGEPLEAAPSMPAGGRSPEQRQTALRHLAGLIRQVHPPDPEVEAIREALAEKPPIPIPTDEEEHVQAAQA